MSLYPNCPVLLVDDEENLLTCYEIMLHKGGITNVIWCSDSRRVMSLLGQHEIEVIVLDLAMPHIDGEKLHQQISQHFPEIPVIIITGSREVETAVRCMKRQAQDYLVKPVEREKMLTSVRQAIKIRELQRENNSLKACLFAPGPKNTQAFAHIITASKKMRSIFQYMEAIAGTSQPLLINGETGTGKELFARAFFHLSQCRGEFVPINIAGLDDNIFADTLFGHRRGAFTGADNERPGLVEKANAGMLFLDEIGDLSIASQLKLLRLLQENEYYPLGTDSPKRANTRIVVATNHLLANLEESGRFRKDLYYRLQTHQIYLPPLRQRQEDIPVLVEHFASEAAHAFAKKKPIIPEAFYQILVGYTFPGNVRELRSLIFDAVSQHYKPGNKLSLDTVKLYLGQRTPATGFSLAISPSTPLKFGKQLPTLQQACQLLVLEALKRANNNQTIAAQFLGISQQALSKRLKRLRLNDDMP